MKLEFLVLALTFAIASDEAAYAGVNYGVPYTQVTENEAKSFAMVGKDESEILKKFGPPNMTDPYGVDGAVWTYLTDPKLTDKATTLYYAGFEVFFQNKKLTYLGIIRGRNSN
jgi:outer membrane protein assembly factor BamE (lipoprotein component of BamABCDE complex)